MSMNTGWDTDPVQGLTEAQVDARVSALSILQAANAGAITPNALSQAIATTAGQSKHFTLATGTIASPLTFTGDGDAIIRVTQVTDGSVVLPTGALQGDNALPTGAATFDIYVVYQVATAAHSILIANLTAIPAPS